MQNDGTKRDLENGKVRYELIDKDGLCVGTYRTAQDASTQAGLFFPGEQQDPDRTGNGWDVEAVR